MTLIHPVQTPRRSTFWLGLDTQMRVIGALIMRELHTRYGRENIGYLWLIGEPMILAIGIASLHSSVRTEYGSDIKALPFVIVGYTTYIMFRGIVNRSEGSMESNGPLLYHRMVTPFDVCLSRAILEAAGTSLAFACIMAFLIALGWAEPPARPLYIFLALALQFWWSWAHSMIVTGISHENKTVGRLVHPYTYLSIPLSGAFFQVEWLPPEYRSYLLWYPMPNILEMVRYGEFHSATLEYSYPGYVMFVTAILTCLGFVSLKYMRKHIHLM